MRGRKPLPTAVKIAKQMKSSRINYLEPKIPEAGAKDLRCPGYFDDSPHGYARDHWKAVVPHLAKAGIITVVDRPMLEAMCLVYEEWRKDPSRPSLFAEWRRFASEFGMSPSSRSRIKIGGHEVDELELFLGESG